ncbi:MAG: DUF262 domain-containing protein, partial [Chlorobiales bacterium]|nr:DUF262 domain-containing protein [Chlorobiales bacterium]
MEFEYEEWTIERLSDLYNEDKLNLSPPYQRNEVWTKSAQRLLIDTITNHQPIPSFFIHKKDNNCFEMVDGQQRSRSMLLFLKKSDKPFTNSGGKTIADHPEFIKYPLSITLITKVSENENIESFYALVNKTGLRLNNPELFKAQYYDTKFLELIYEIVDDDEFIK